MLSRGRRVPRWLAILSLAFLTGAAHAAEKAAATNEHVDEPTGFWHGDINGPVPASIQGGQVLQLAGVQKFIKSGDALIVDVSNAPRKPDGLAPDAPWLPVSHKALPKSIWIPGAGAGEVTPEFDVFLRDRIGMAAQGNYDRPIIVYCHKRCWLSWNGAKRLIAYGYRQVYWYPDGIEGWKAAKLPTVAVKEIAPER
jgi:PQQ-dependent catabolism-associated CXXCW motif protein